MPNRLAPSMNMRSRPSVQPARACEGFMLSQPQSITIGSHVAGRLSDIGKSP
jgi:hypothetical protein